MICNLCPRRCGALREEDHGEGYCRTGYLPVVSRAAPHLWEEPCISGTKGSGTVFFSGCALGCVFCQNEKISHHPLGRVMTPQQLSETIRRLEGEGVHNINLVTPSHFAPAIRQALNLYKPGVPVVWNSSAYETPEMIRSMEGLVDIFLPDLKYHSEKSAAVLADAPDYFETAMAAIETMCAQTGLPRYDENGMLLSGTLVRHLVLPLRVKETIAILESIKARLPEGTPVSLMRQYTPMQDTGLKGLDRRLTDREYRQAREHMEMLGLDGYLQKKEAANSIYTPRFMDQESTRLFPGET